MSRTTVNVIACDLCGYGGAYTQPEDFRTIKGVDLCRWCADDKPKAWQECGRHLVTFSDDTWTCSCGESYVRPFFLLSRVRDAVPNMLNATANQHVQSA